MGARRRGTHRRGSKAAAADASSDEQPAARAVRQPPRATGLKPDEPEVLRAVESLYADQLKPFGRILRKRLSERAAEASPELVEGSSSSSALPDIDIRHLRAVCDECARFQVTPEEGGDWSVVLIGRDAPFVDIYSPVDCYSEEFWGTLAEYFDGLAEEDRVLPGGRYSCAQMLLGRQLPFLEAYSLGKLCHIVQLAISQRKVLGYSDGAVVPYKHSQSMVKEQCALSGQACAAANGPDAPAAGMPLATWDVARKHLREILEGAEAPEDGEPPQVPLSNVKRLFRSRFNTELSETTLGYSKLSDLLQDQRFHDICRVELQGHGYTVVQNFEQPSVTKISLAESLLEPAAVVAAPFEGLAEPRRLEFSSLEELCIDDYLDSKVPSTMPLMTPLASPGVPASTTIRKWTAPAEAPPLSFFPEEPLGSQGEVSGQGSGLCSSQFSSLPPLESPAVASAPRSVWCQDEPLNFEEAEPGLMTPGFASATPMASPGVPPSATVRRWPIAQPEVPQRVEFCPNEPLCPEEAGFAGLPSLSGLSPGGPLSLSPGGQLPCSTPLRSPGVPPSATTRRWPSLALSPSTLAKDGRVGSIVQNTFIHAAQPPPTPQPGARVRSSSLPKDVGSDKSSWESACHTLGWKQRPIADGATESTADSGSARISVSDAVPLSRASSLSGQDPAFAAASRSLSPEMEVDAATPKRVALGSLESALPPRLLLAPRDIGAADEHPASATAGGRVAFCINEPLPLEEVGIFPDDVTPAARHTAKSPARWTVQNTFIHQAMAPPTPMPGAVRRSRSVPKDAGSDNFEAPTPVIRQLPRCGLGVASPGTRRDTCPSIEASPAFVPTSPALTASPGGLAYKGSGGGWSMPKPRQGDDTLVLRLADHL